MMQRIYLTLDPQGIQSFDAIRLRRIVAGLKCIGNWVEGSATADPEGTLFQCTVAPVHADLPIPIEVRKDLQSMSIGGYDDAGLQAAIEIHRSYGQEVFAFSEESSPDAVPLSAVTNVADLASKLKLRT